MNTNQMMTRKMGNKGNFTVTQRTVDGFFNATDLIKQWNTLNQTERKLDNYFNSDKTQEFIDTIMKRQNLNTPNLVYLKRRGKYNGGTWMTPLLFIDFAMWINPSFKYDVLRFVYDEMIKYRNEAGDAYKDLGKAIGKFVDPTFMPVAMSKVGEAINWIVFNDHHKGIRNEYGDGETQRELAEFEKKLTMLINENFIKSYDSLMDYLRKQFLLRHTPKVLA